MASIEELKASIKAMEAEKDTDIKLLIKSYRDIVTLEAPIHPKNALEYAEKALTLAKESGDNVKLAICLRYRAYCHRFLGNKSQAIKDTKSELKLWRNSKDIIGDTLAEERLSGGYNNLGAIYSEQGDFKNAYEYFLKALNAKKKPIANSDYPCSITI